MGDKTKRATELFNARSGCAQSVAAAFSADCGLDEDVLKKLACPLNGGCQSAELCGAVSGAAVVVGLKYGQCVEGDMAARAVCNEKMEQFLNAFRADFGDKLTCRELLGFDISTPEGGKQYGAMIREKSPCAGFVRRSAEILEESVL